MFHTNYVKEDAKLVLGFFTFLDALLEVLCAKSFPQMKDSEPYTLSKASLAIKNSCQDSNFLLLERWPS